MLLASASLAQQTYRVREGDTFGHVAEKLGVTQADLRRSNPSVQPDRLQIGQRLVVPRRRESVPARAASVGGYQVRAGDNDERIAAKLGISVAQLHRSNPGVRWRSLQIGQRLNVPGRDATAERKAPATASTSPADAGAIVVRPGDNDWTIARRLGIRVSKLHELNPGVAWRSLQIGQTLRGPGTPPRTARIATKRAKVIRDAVIVRREPSTEAKRVARIDRGRVATIVDRENGWYKLRFEGGVSGWVRGDLLAPVGAAAVANKASPPRPEPIVKQPPKRVAAQVTKSGLQLLDTANRYRGVRYRFGGTTSRGFDCSGFVSHVFRTHGIRLPRTSSEQATVGQAVAKENLRKGDLVFFRTRGSRISHVGIYIGGGQFIHSSSGGGKVEVDSLVSGYYQRRYAGARRVSTRLAPSGSGQNDRPARSSATAKTPEAPPQPPRPTIERPRLESVGTDEISR